ncbi:MAG: WGR domain-containing protein [Enhygromyxa sp.]
MRRFEFREGKSNKFWEIEVDGSTLRTRHGRIGTAGRESQKPYGTPASAARQAESAIASKLKKGYVEVDSATPAEPKASEPEPDTPLAALERKLIADPQAYDDWLVYADALATAGDPRGELITIGVALAREQGDAKQLRAREDALLQANAEAWFGKFVSDDDWRECFGWTLSTGFWGRIRFWVDYDHTGTDIPKALAYALSHPSAKFLRELVLGLTSAEGDADYDGCIRALINHGPLPSLRTLMIGDFERDESEISWVQVGNVGPLWPLIPNIEHLTLRGAGIRLGSPKSTTLRSLTIHTGGLPQAAGQALGRAELPALERLVVWFGTTHYGGSCSAAEARGILQNKSFAQVRSLALADADFADEIAAEVAQAELWPALERLDLSMGTMTDAGAERLLARAKQLARLAHIDLSENFLSPQMCDRIRAALPNAKVDSQKHDDGDWRYVSVGE